MLLDSSSAESNVREKNANREREREKAKQSSHQAMTVVHHCVINQGVKSVPALCRSSYQLARSLLLLLQNSNSIATATILCISQQLVPALRALASLQLFHNGSTSILKHLQKIHILVNPLSTPSNKGTFDDNFASFDHLPKSIWTFLILNADKTGSFGPPALFSSPRLYSPNKCFWYQKMAQYLLFTVM